MDLRVEEPSSFLLTGWYSPITAASRGLSINSNPVCSVQGLFHKLRLGPT